MKQELQTVEFKESWDDDYLKTVCAFANTDGGVFYIGVNDDRRVIGVKDIKKLIEVLPNKIMSHFSITASVEVLEENGIEFVKLTVPQSSTAVSYRGRFYARCGSTSQELKGGELQELLLKANNLTWDKVGVDNADYNDIDNETVTRFVNEAMKHNRLPRGIDGGNVTTLFQNLKLITNKGGLTRAAVLLFGKDPSRFFSTATFKIGRFKGDSPIELMFDDRIEGNLFSVFDQVINFLKSKYLISPISYQGMRRVETLEIPDNAIREAILNALIHKDYTNTSAISLRVYDPTVSIWNFGELDHLKIIDLSREHGSFPRNPLLAEMFYRAGYIEAWGRGTLTIIDETIKHGLPKPTFQVRDGGLLVTFQRDLTRLVSKSEKSPLKPDSELLPRQQKAVEYVRENGSITNSIYRDITGASRRTVIRDLTELVENNVFKKKGTAGRSIKYVLSQS